MTWDIVQEGFHSENVIHHGNKFLIGNGYLGYRGTLEEHRKDSLVACNLAAVYDRFGDQWREPVNAPNGLFTTVRLGNNELGCGMLQPVKHVQQLNIRDGLHNRETEFITTRACACENKLSSDPIQAHEHDFMPLTETEHEYEHGHESEPDYERDHDHDRISVVIRAQRFASLANVHLLCMKYSISVSDACDFEIVTGIDTEVWDINGPHLGQHRFGSEQGILSVNARTGELGLEVAVSEACCRDFSADETMEENCLGIYRHLKIHGQAGRVYTIYKYVSVHHGRDEVDDPTAAGKALVEAAVTNGFEVELMRHRAAWEERWKISDVIIDGNAEDQLALRYSIYQLHILAPAHAKDQSIAARGLSGQTYKGAIFWDTEMFMLPFFLHTAPDTARSLIRYRINALDGARRKAAFYGYKGAFYAWESHEGGEDACSDFNVTDVFTGRPVKTYFRDKQVHISAAVAHGIWETYLFTGDLSILAEGGVEVLLECARFYYSYAYFKEDKDRYELLDVIGPDEYHERVNNNAYTSKMAQHTVDIALKALKLLSKATPEVSEELVKRLGIAEELGMLERFLEKLYVPSPEESSLVIEQFDGYDRLEDCTVADVRSRLLDPREYWGGGHGVATTTKVLKQADVVLMLYLFRSEYGEAVKKANWHYYEPRTEHGSSLSPCIYSLLACDIGNEVFAYPYFVKSANIDLTGESKQFAGSIYIGGTHPAANGGAWMSAIFGFGGLSVQDGVIKLTPRLPKEWSRLAFNIVVRGQQYAINITRDGAECVAVSV